MTNSRDEQQQQAGRTTCCNAESYRVVPDGLEYCVTCKAVAVFPTTTVQPQRKPRPRVRVEVSTVDFEFAHGRTPRGRGTWAFTFDQRHYRDVLSAEVFWSTPGTYSEAKRQAVAEAQRRGARVVYVQS